MSNNPGASKPDHAHQKSIFSYNVYRTNSHQRPNYRTINFKPNSTLSKDPQVLFLNKNLFKTKEQNDLKEISTQTSKTILQLLENEKKETKDGELKLPAIKDLTITRNRSGSPVRIGLQIEILDDKNEAMSPDSLAASPNFDRNYSVEHCPYSVASKLSNFTLEGSCHEQIEAFNGNKPLIQTFLEKKKDFKSKSFIEYPHPNYIQESKINQRPKVNRRSCKSLELPDNSFGRLRASNFNPNSTFMCPTTSSQIKSKMTAIQSINSLIPPMRRGRSTSPKPTSDQRRFECSKKIPYIDQSKSDVSSSTTLVNANRHPELLRLKNLDAEISKSDCSAKFSDDVLSMITTLDASSSDVNNTTILLALNKLQEPDWRIALRGLADAIEICRISDIELIYDYMPCINQRLIELLKSPRSHVCRTACQAAGHLFEYVKDTRRPLFDEIVDLLLHKTADANKFIRHDSNMSLDCMVTHISTYHAVRTLCAKGPCHKNPLVRCATARLLVCAIVIAGVEFLFEPQNHEHSRRRIILTMAKFLEDKNLETRKLAERLYKVLSKDMRFDVYLRKYIDKEKITKMKTQLKFIHKK